MSNRPFPSPRRFRAGCIALALAALVPQPAHAQSDEDRATARKLSFEAATALEAKEYAGAAEKFARADALFHAPTLTLGLARAQVGLGKLVAAQESYQRIVREGVPAGGNKQFEDAVKDATRELAALEPRVPWVTVQVTGGSNVSVTLDNNPLNAAALGVKRAIDPGQHTLRATAAGFRAAERPFTMAEGQAETVTLTLEPEAAAGAANPVPAGAIAVPPAGGDTTTASKGGSPMKLIGFIALGVGAAGLIGGGITGGLAISEHSLLDRDCDSDGDCPAERRETLDNFHTLSTLSTVGFIVGGVGVAGGITLLVLAPSSRKQSGATIVPYAGLGQVGAVGRF
ncbi:MAG: carboxypeptidase-like regulatory domain-containing protein [Polyangiaceae bacterium]